MWYYVVNGQQLGPFDQAQFEGLVAAGTITPNTHVWKEGLPNWLPLREARSGPDVCQVCYRVVGADHLVELEGTRVCAACKPVALQRIREGVKPSAEAPSRPVMVWVISLFYFICTPLGIISVLVMPLLMANLPMPDAQRKYFASQNFFDYAFGLLAMGLNLTAAVQLFRLRRQAFTWFLSTLLLVPINLVYQIMFKHWLDVIGSNPGGLVGAAIGFVFSIGINVAIVLYAWHLKTTKVLR